MAWHNEWPHKVYASVLLLDGKIEGWKTGNPPKKEPGEFKAYWKRDRLNDYTAEYVGFEVNNDKEHNDAFEKLAPEWFRQWELAEDLHGAPPYSDEADPQLMDTKSKLTPGPWKFNERMGVVYGPNGWKVAHIFNFEGNGEADANLITAAPDMYEACRKALNLLHQHSIYGETELALRDAIGKSQGGES